MLLGLQLTSLLVPPPPPFIWPFFFFFFFVSCSFPFVIFFCCLSHLSPQRLHNYERLSEKERHSVGDSPATNIPTHKKNGDTQSQMDSFFWKRILCFYRVDPLKVRHNNNSVLEDFNTKMGLKRWIHLANYHFSLPLPLLLPFSKLGSLGYCTAYISF